MAEIPKCRWLSETLIGTESQPPASLFRSWNPLQNGGKKSPSRGADCSGFSLDIQTCKAVKVTSRVVGISPAVTMSSSFIGITPFWPIGGSIMFTRIFGLFALAISLIGTQCWAQACVVEELNCHTFSPTST